MKFKTKKTEEDVKIITLEQIGMGVNILVNDIKIGRFGNDDEELVIWEDDELKELGIKLDVRNN